jgi:hypothetical protein
VRGDFDPHRRLVGAAQPEEVIGDGAVPAQPAEKGSTSNGRTSASATSLPNPNISLRWGLAATVSPVSADTVPM